MTWYKVDDSLHSHPKTRAAGMAAMGLWVLAGSYASQYATEGFVPEWFVLSWPSGKRYAGQLVGAGMWDPGTKTGEAGWWFHDWDHYQPTLADIEREREKGRERQRRFKERRNGVTNGVDNGVTTPPNNGVSNGPPSRPVPSLTTVETNKGQSPSLRLSDDGLRKVQALTKGDLAHADKTATIILTRARTVVANPTRYVLAAIEAEPDLYRQRRGNPTSATCCSDHPGEWADACRIHAAEARLGGTS